MTEAPASGKFSRPKHVNGLEVLQSIATEGNLIARIDALLEDGEALAHHASTSFVHALGFEKFALPSDDPDMTLHMHMWRPETAATPARNHVHNHRAGLASLVVMGALTTELFARSTNAMSFTEYREEISGPDWDWHLRRVGPAALARLAVVRLEAGSTYALSADTLHRVSPDPARFTATLVLSETPFRSETEVFAPPDERPPLLIRKVPPRPDEYRGRLLSLRMLLASSSAIRDGGVR